MIKKIDPKNLKFIEEEDIPVKKILTATPWVEIFSSIPKGKVLVFHPDEVGSDTVRSALKRLQNKGKFEHLHMTSRKIGDRKYISYVVNSSKKNDE